MEESGINFNDYPQLQRSLEQINQLGDNLKSLEVKAKKMLEAGLEDIARQLKNARIGRTTGAAYTAEPTEQTPIRLDTKL